MNYFMRRFFIASCSLVSLGGLRAELDINALPMGALVSVEGQSLRIPVGSVGRIFIDHRTLEVSAVTSGKMVVSAMGGDISVRLEGVMRDIPSGSSLTVE